MSYRNHFRYGHDGHAQRQLWINFTRPETIYETGDIKRYDRNAAGDIAQLESLLAELKEYRLDLAQRFAELETMPYTYKLYLTRYKSWSTKHVTYTVRLARVLPDGKEIDERREQFGGADRKKAFELFAQIKRERPGIEAIQDTDKKQWER